MLQLLHSGVIRSLIMRRYISGCGLKVLRLFLLALLLTSTVIGAGNPRIAQPVYGDTSTQVTVNAPLGVALEQEFIVRVEVNNVSDFNSCNYDISFNPLVLQVVDLNPGTTELNIGDGLINSMAIPVTMTNVIP